MVKSDGNGSYIIDKNIWKAAIAIIAILCAVVGYAGQHALGAIDTAKIAIDGNALMDAQQEVRLALLKEQLDRIEAKLDVYAGRK